MQFADALIANIKLTRTPLIVGIDPRMDQLPLSIRTEYSASGRDPWEAQAQAYEIFSKGIIDVVAGTVPAIKPQMAFFEELGPAGMFALARVIDYAQSRQLMVILDGKRNDIGSTAEAYAAAYLGRKPLSPWGADALTINPWMGFDTLMPFVKTAKSNAAGLFILTKTSNPGSRDLQEQVANGETLYGQIARHVESLSLETVGQTGYGIAGAVVGATYPQQLHELRAIMPHTLFLVPGFGAQGGTASDVAGAFDNDGLGAVINSSRGIIFAYNSAEFSPANSQSWQEAIEGATHKAIEQIANETPAGRLR